MTSAKPAKKSMKASTDKPTVADDVTVDNGDLVTIMDSQAVVSSRAVAERFHKRHDKLTTEIKRMYSELCVEGDAHQMVDTPVFYAQQYTNEQNHRKYTEYIMNRDAFCLLVMGFTGKEALEWKLKYIAAFNRMDSILQSKTIEKAIAAAKDKRLDHIENMLEQSGIFDVFTNPRYSFYQFRYFYVTTTGDDSPRGFYDSIADYTGIVVPMSYNIKTTVIEWILNNIPMDYIKEFALGVKAGSIVRSDEGHWVNLNGYDSGCGVEWEKTKRFFGNRCAYCGEEAPLIPEHIVPQTVMSTIDPRRVDISENIVCTCSACNREKGTQEMHEWYRKSKGYSKYRLGRIHEWQRQHRISELPE